MSDQRCPPASTDSEAPSDSLTLELRRRPVVPPEEQPASEAGSLDVPSTLSRGPEVEVGQDELPGDVAGYEVLEEIDPRPRYRPPRPQAIERAAAGGERGA